MGKEKREPKIFPLLILIKRFGSDILGPDWQIAVSGDAGTEPGD